MLRAFLIFNILFVFQNSIAQVVAPLQWVKGLGGVNWDEGYSVTTDANGNVYTTGHFSGNADFDPNIGTYNMSSVGVDDVFITKLNAVGNFVWAAQIGGTGPSTCIGKRIQTDKKGNVFTIGTFQGTADFNPGIGTYTLAAKGSKDVFISKLDTSGNFIWAVQFGGNSAFCDGNCIAIDDSGYVYSTGLIYNTVDLDPGAGVFNLSSNPGGFSDVFISKLDSMGNFKWAKNMGGISADCFGRGISLDNFGGVITTGCFYGTVDFDPGASIFAVSSFSTNAYDEFVSKFTRTGNHVWTKKIGGIANDENRTVAVDKKGNIFTTGNFQGAADFDPGPGSYTLNSVSVDVFISKLDSAGNFKWAKSFGGSSTDYGLGIICDTLCNVYSTGDFIGSMDLDPGPGTYSVGSIGANNIFVLKLDSAGSFKWGKTTAGTPNGFEATGISLDNLGNVLVSGFLWFTANFNSSGPVYNLSSAGKSDAYVFKLSPCDAITQEVSILNSNLVCMGDIIILTAAGAATYTWNTGATTSSISVTPTVNTTYSVVGITSLGCTNSNSINIIVNAVPIISATSSASLICTGQSVTLTASGANNYTWTPGGTGTIISITPSVSTTFTLNGTDLNNCSDTSTLSVLVSPCTAIEESNNTNFTIFPNPSTGKVHISLSFISKEIKIIDALGNETYHQSISSDKAELNLNHLANGVYIIQIENEGRFYNRKLLINR